MVIWLEDLVNHDDEGTEPETDADVPAGQGPTHGAEPDEVVDVTDEERRTRDRGAADRAIADDDGWSLTDVEAARFTRH